MRMQRSSEVTARRRRRPLGIAAAAAGLAVALTVADDSDASSKDKYAVKVPDGLAFLEFKGFEAWQTVAVSQSGKLIEVILGNSAMIKAYRAGIPDNGKPFPDGVKMVKIHWNAKQSAEAPSPTTVPDTLHDIDFMVRDSKRFSKIGNWGYAQFNYDTASDTFTPLGTGPACGFTCHTIVAKRDYVFTSYGKR